MNWIIALLKRIGIDLTPRKELYQKIEELEFSVKELTTKVCDFRETVLEKDRQIWNLEDEIRLLHERIGHEDEWDESNDSY